MSSPNRRLAGGQARRLSPLDRREFLLGFVRYAVLAGLAVLTALVAARGRARSGASPPAAMRRCQGCPARGQCTLQIADCRWQSGKE